MDPKGRATVGVFGLVFLVALFYYDGPTTGYWDTYIAAPAAHLTARTLDFRLQDGGPAYDVTLRGVLPDDLVDLRPGGFGYITEDQRLGAAILAAPAYEAWGRFGLRAIHALAWASGAALITAASAGVGLGPAVFGGLAAALNPYALSVCHLNANVFALPILALLLLLPARGRALVLSGLLLGVLGGVRNECVLIVPFFAWRAWRGGGLRGVATLAVGLVTLLPSLLWQRWAFGSFVMHASQFGGFEGFRPTFPHALGPWRFDFNGLLNWPLHDHVVRTPHFAYPTFVLLPLVALRSLGALGVALAAVGGWRRRGLLLGWIAPLWAMLSVQENWEELKMTYLVLLLPALGVLLAEGGAAVRAVRVRTVWIGVAIAVWGLGHALHRVRAPLDERWYVRFPHAATNDAGFPVLPHERRWSWEFFHSREAEAELHRERARLEPRWLPGLYRDRGSHPGAELAGMRSELGDHRITTLAIWKYIYTVDPP